jgi:hypothetical protein
MAHKPLAPINGNNMMPIFVTGGTFDKEYNELYGSNFSILKMVHLRES